MESNRNIPHHFDLSGLRPGDWFLGCKNCWFRLDGRVAAHMPTCPKCGATTTSIFDVTADDLSDVQEQTFTRGRVFSCKRGRVRSVDADPS